MVISFTNEKAWEHLKEFGFVTTFRPKRERPDIKTWANRGRGEPKEFDVLVTELGKVVFGEDEQVMHRTAGASGFGSPPVWRNAIREIHGEIPDQGWIYLVKKKDE